MSSCRGFGRLAERCATPGYRSGASAYRCQTVAHGPCARRAARPRRARPRLEIDPELLLASANGRRPTARRLRLRESRRVVEPPQEAAVEVRLQQAIEESGARAARVAQRRRTRLAARAQPAPRRRRHGRVVLRDRRRRGPSPCCAGRRRPSSRGRSAASRRRRGTGAPRAAAATGRSPRPPEIVAAVAGKVDDRASGRRRSRARRSRRQARSGARWRARQRSRVVGAELRSGSRPRSDGRTGSHSPALSGQSTAAGATWSFLSYAAAVERRDEGVEDRAVTHSRCLLPRRPLLGEREVEVVEALGAVGVLAAVLVPLDVELGAQDAGGHEGADVEAHAVVEVGLPAERLLGERLPAHVDVVGRLALEDQLELAPGARGRRRGAPRRRARRRAARWRSIQSPR